MNASLYSQSVFVFQSKTRHFTRGSQTMENFRTSIVTFETEVTSHILKMTLPQKNGHRIKTPSSELMILVSSCWKKNFIRNNGHSLFILSLVFLKSLIIAFFLGHPVYFGLVGMAQLYTENCIINGSTFRLPKTDPYPNK